MRPIAVLTAAIAVVGSNSLVLAPIAAEVADGFQTTAPNVLLGSALFGAGTAFSALFLATRADALGLARALTLAVSAIAVGLILSSLAPSLIWLIVAQCLVGLGSGTALPCTYAITADLAPKDREAETLGVVLTGWTISLVAGVSLSAIIADLLHWRPVFALMALASVVITLFISRLPNAPAPRGTLSKNPLKSLKIPGVPQGLFYAAAFMTAFYGSYGYLGAHLTGPLGLSTTFSGIAALFYGIGFGASAVFDRYIDQFGQARARPIAFGTLVVTYLLLASFAQHSIPLVALCMIWGAINHFGLNLIVSNLTALEPTKRAAILGLYSATTYLAMFFGTAIYGQIFAHYGFAGCAIASALCVVPVLVLVTRRRAAPV